MNAQPNLTLVPPAQPEDAPLSGVALEEASREEMLRALHWHVTVAAPTWKSLMYFGKPLAFQVPRVPGGVGAEIRALKPDSFVPTAVGLGALKLAEALQKSQPQPTPRRSISATIPLPPSKGEVSKWNRDAFLVSSGPACLPLLVSAGYLTPDDIELMETVYPHGLGMDNDPDPSSARLLAVDAARSFSQVGARHGHDPVLPAWLNDQLFTLMDEDRQTGHFQALYDDAAKAAQQQPGPSAGAGNSKIAQQFRPQVGAGSDNT